MIGPALLDLVAGPRSRKHDPSTVASYAPILLAAGAALVIIILLVLFAYRRMRRKRSK